MGRNQVHFSVSGIEGEKYSGWRLLENIEEHESRFLRYSYNDCLFHLRSRTIIMNRDKKKEKKRFLEDIYCVCKLINHFSARRSLTRLEACLTKGRWLYTFACYVLILFYVYFIPSSTLLSLSLSHFLKYSFWMDEYSFQIFQHSYFPVIPYNAQTLLRC